MSFDLEALRAAVRQHGRVARVVVAAVRGSAPREVGAAMLVWEGGQSGTIGGGALEHQAAARALSGDALSRHALGPDLGQCCGGSVSLLCEVYDAARLAGLSGSVLARPLPGRDRAVPLGIARVLAQARGSGVMPTPRMLEGWMIEPVSRPTRDLWIWGAGHVGRALVDVLAPLPDFALTWIDTGPDRFPERVPDAVRVLPAVEPVRLIGHAPSLCEHLVLTYSHALDLDLCHGLLAHGFGFAGLIGSASKWARFRARLRDLGHGADQIARITCPIGLTHLGKHPQAIAVGVAACLLEPARKADVRQESSA